MTERAMSATTGNLHADIPSALPDELQDALVKRPGLRIERIVSKGHASAPGSWYDQQEDEFVLLVAGAARLELEGGRELELRPGDWVQLPARVRHRVAWTDPECETVWLAVFSGGTAASAG